MSQSDIYTILCVVDKGNVAFSVKIDKNEIIGELKKAIIKEKPSYANINPHSLDLYLVDIPDADKAELKASVETQALDLPQRPSSPLIEIFPTGPKPKTVQFIVKTTTSLFPLTPARSKEMKAIVTDFEGRLRPKFTRFLEDNVQLPLWQPTFKDKDLQSHIASLKIPIISPPHQFPSLLVHNLGQPSHDAQLVKRIEELFSPGSGRRLLCNASGSGKTRLLLEGLWRYWGYYFTARPQPEGLGSSDLEQVLLDLDQAGRLRPLGDENRNTMQDSNQITASRRSLLVLYARSVVFRVFLECAAAMPGGITENHKGRWVLIQVAPETLLGESDVFLELTLLAGGASLEYLRMGIRMEHLTIRRLLGSESPAIFCVLDEAQVPANMFLDCFLSGTETRQRRPILHQIIHEWRLILPDLIVSGTEVPMQEVETVLASDVAKEGAGGALPPPITDIGGFENEVDQRAYLMQYLPPGFLDTALGREISSRAGYWLRGQYRFTATYISRLLRTGLESPHRALNDVVEDMTGFRPSDWDNLS